MPPRCSAHRSRPAAHGRGVGALRAGRPGAVAGRPCRRREELRELEHLLEVHQLADADLVPGPELVDALLRLGRPAMPRPAAAAYQRAARAKGQPWALARAARARGLVADDARPAVLRGGAEAHAATFDRFETARTRLAYGERLRRAATPGRRPGSAARRPRRLRGPRRGTLGRATAAGAGSDRRDASPAGRRPAHLLTPQELQVSLLLVEGRTTREAAAALFLSPKTVEYHLRKVYTKLGIGSRRSSRRPSPVRPRADRPGQR